MSLDILGIFSEVISAFVMWHYKVSLCTQKTLHMETTNKQEWND